MLDSDFREQAAAIAYRRVRGEAEICLIRRKDAHAWGIPKGFVEPGHTRGEAALEEAWEEAGIRGRIVGNRLGTYEYEKRGDVLMVSVYLVEVLDVHARWEESWRRERRWCRADEAVALLRDHPAHDLVARAGRLLASGHQDAGDAS